MAKEKSCWPGWSNPIEGRFRGMFPGHYGGVIPRNTNHRKAPMKHKRFQPDAYGWRIEYRNWLPLPWVVIEPNGERVFFSTQESALVLMWARLTDPESYPRMFEPTRPHRARKTR